MRSPLVALLLVVACTSASTRTGDLELTDVQVRMAPAGAATAAIYFTVHNSGTRDDTLRTIRSSAGAISLHESRSEAGMMQMSPLLELVVPAGETIRFTPGARHGMLEHFARPLAVSDTLTLEFGFARSGSTRLATTILPVVGVE